MCPLKSRVIKLYFNYKTSSFGFIVKVTGIFCRKLFFKDRGCVWFGLFLQLPTLHFCLQLADINRGPISDKKNTEIGIIKKSAVDLPV